MSEVREIQDVCPTAEDISSQPLSNFEAKYVAAKQPIYRLIINAAIEESDAGSNPKS